jgi:hypothetical protein
MLRKSSLIIFFVVAVFPISSVFSATPVSIKFQGKVNNGPNYGYYIECSNRETYNIVAWGGDDSYSPAPSEDDEQKYSNFNFEEYTGVCLDVFAYRFCETR